MKIIYPDGTYTASPHRCLLPTPKERAEWYEKASIVAMDNGEYLKSDIYAEWARLELLQIP